MTKRNAEMAEDERFQKLKEKYNQIKQAGHSRVHPGKLMRNLKITQLKRKIIFQTSMTLGSMLIFQWIQHPLYFDLLLIIRGGGCNQLVA